jgi:hypothetical protein
MKEETVYDFQELFSDYQKMIDNEKDKDLKKLFTNVLRVCKFLNVITHYCEKREMCVISDIIATLIFSVCNNSVLDLRDIIYKEYMDEYFKTPCGYNPDGSPFTVEDIERLYAEHMKDNKISS